MGIFKARILYYDFARHRVGAQVLGDPRPQDIRTERRASASKGFRMGRKRQDASANDVLWLQREKEISAVKL